MTLREQITADIVQQVGNHVEEALLLFAPVGWPDEERDAIAEQVVAHTRLMVDSLTTDELRSSRALNHHIDNAVSETKRLIRGWR